MRDYRILSELTIVTAPVDSRPAAVHASGNE